MRYQDMTLMDVFKDVIGSVPAKIYDVLSTVWGKFITLLIFCGSFLGDRLPLLYYITIAIAIDGAWGIATALRNGRFILSTLIKKSAVKIFAYVSIYGIVALIEKGYTSGEFMITSSIIASILIASELWSILGHIGIAYPDWLVVKLLKRYLKGEMSKKLDIPEEELDKILYSKKQELPKNNKNDETKSRRNKSSKKI